MRYGGNTACVSIDAPGTQPICFDLGTGLRFWGQTMPADGTFRGTALVSHLHWDHVQGLPFFAPINWAGASLDIYAPPPEDGFTVEEAFGEFMRPPYFPVRATDLFGDIRFHDICNADLEIDRAKVKVRPIPHVGNTNGYRIEVDGFSIAYLSDHQQPMDGSWEVPATVLELCGDADLVIHDAQYTSDEFELKSHWGHCTVDYAVHVAGEAGAKRLALFHHDPAHDDLAVDLMLEHARVLASKYGIDEVLGAAEGLSIALGARVPSR